MPAKRRSGNFEEVSHYVPKTPHNFQSLLFLASMRL